MTIAIFLLFTFYLSVLPTPTQAVGTKGVQSPCDPNGDECLPNLDCQEGPSGYVCSSLPTMNSCQTQPGGGCWRVIRYSDFSECTDNYANSSTICWSQCAPSACNRPVSPSPLGFIGPPAPNPLDAIFGQVKVPSAVASFKPGAGGISTFLGNVLQLLYIAGILIFVFMIVLSAVQWIASGGDKEKYGKARERLTHAVIGITLLGLAGVIITLVGKILNFKFFG